jgi:ribosomal protein L29
MTTKNKTNKVKLSTSTLSELQADVKRLKLEIASSAVKIAAKKEKNTRKVFNLRKLLAKSLTLLKQKLLDNEAKKGV